MNIDVAKAIKELLYTNEAVILPGLGGFTGSPVSAVVDYVQGSVQPPSRKLEFNPNLVINDGILVNHIQKSEVITAQEATVAIDNYVNRQNMAQSGQQTWPRKSSPLAIQLLQQPGRHKKVHPLNTNPRRGVGSISEAETYARRG